jgi:hypothetical protein
MMIALVVFSVIAGSALSVFRSQSRGFRLGSERMAAVQNGRFALDQLTRDLRTVGTGTTDEQPFLIYAGADVVAFNANLISNLANDVFAVYVDVNAPSGTVAALQQAQRITLPNTAVGYPDTTYMNGAVNSSAETIVLFFRPDSSTARTDDFALFRQINQQAPELVARNLLRNGTTPFFRYHRLSAPANAPLTVAQIPDNALPIRHAPPLHLSAGDTGVVATIDSVRAVEVQLVATNGLAGAEERTRQFTRLIRLPNAGLAQKKTCGDQPLLGVSLTAAAIVQPSGDPAVLLTWNRATDEGGGENDVVRYVIWRKAPAATDWGEGFVSVPSGQANYQYTDQTVTSGDQWQYSLAAQDCTPSLSSLSPTGTITIP